MAPADFVLLLKNQRIISIGRRAKFLVLGLSNGYTLLIHLRMSGRLIIHPSRPRGKHEHIILEFDDGLQLSFHDTRKFGRWYLTKKLDQVLGKLGPEPLDPTFTSKQFERMLKAKSRQIKPLLLDQTFIAGLGNIYVDEALWTAKIHPMAISNELTSAECRKLFDGIRAVLLRGLERQGTSLGKGKANFYGIEGRQGKHQDIMNVFRRTGKPCARCGTLIKRIVVGQRSTHICPQCQKCN